MKYRLLVYIALLFITACKQEVTGDEIKKINGYWEIEKVILADGTKKEYTINETIDYFFIKGNTGFRKKVRPELNGTYLINNQSEKITILKDENAFFIVYKTKYTKFKEQIIQIEDSILVLKNNQNVEYHYKKPIPFSIK